MWHDILCASQPKEIEMNNREKTTMIRDTMVSVLFEISEFLDFMSELQSRIF